MYLGFDLSTQQLKAAIIDKNHEIQQEAYIQFDNDLPEFRTCGGVIKCKDNPKVITSPTLMWVKALDMILEKLQLSGTDFSQIIAISGCAQQHGTVYWAKNSQEKLKTLNSAKYLHEQLSESFSLTNSPTWMDSSTKEECAMLEGAIGGPLKMAEITGSRAYERFSGAQITKVAHKMEDVYLKTERISLVSSFLASLLIGDYAPIDWSDGSGMNLLNIHTKTWDNDLLKICGAELRQKLGDPVPSSTDIGFISKYFIEKYGFQEKCKVIAFTGDNPSSLVGMGLKKGDIACSLGTSDTLFLWLEEAQVIQNGHILCNPLDEKSFMALLCFRNGSLTRERIRNTFANKSWELFNELLSQTGGGNNGNLALYFDTQEVMPALTGDYRFNAENHKVEHFISNKIDIRAVIEGQFLTRRIYAEDFGLVIDSQTKIVVTGGASQNRAILQILSDVFNCPVYVSNSSNAAVLGAAYLAKLGYLNANKTTTENQLNTNCSKLTLVCRPCKNAQSIYVPLLNRLRSIIQDLLSERNVQK